MRLFWEFDGPPLLLFEKTSLMYLFTYFFLAEWIGELVLIFWKNNNPVISTFCPSMKILSWFWPQLLPWFVLGGFIMMHHVTIFLAKSWQRIYPPWNFSSCPCQPPESILEKLGNCQVSILYKKFSSFVRS